MKPAAKSAEIIVYVPNEAALHEAVAQCKGLKIKDVNDKDGYKAVHAARVSLKKCRTEIEAKRKDLKAEALAYGRRVDDEAKRLTAIIEPTELELGREQKRIDDELERIKREADEAAAHERARILDGRMRDLSSVGDTTPPSIVTQWTDAGFRAHMAEARERFEAEQRERHAEEQRRKAEAEQLERERVAMKAEREKLERERRELEAKRATLTPGAVSVAQIEVAVEDYSLLGREQVAEERDRLTPQEVLPQAFPGPWTPEQRRAANEIAAAVLEGQSERQPHGPPLCAMLAERAHLFCGHVALRATMGRIDVRLPAEENPFA